MFKFCNCLDKITILIALFFLVSCQKDFIVVNPISENHNAHKYSSRVPHTWFSYFEIIDRYAPGYAPPISARATAYIGFAGYEAAVHGMEGYRSLANYYPDLILPQPDLKVKYHWPSAVNAAYNRMFRKFYPHIRHQDQIEISRMYIGFQNEFIQEFGEQLVLRSEKFGESIADAVFEWSKRDLLGHEAYLNPFPSAYHPAAGPGLWVSTPPNFPRALVPYWGDTRTFAIKRSETIGLPPLPFSEDSSSLFYGQAKEVQNWANQVYHNQDFEWKWIGEWWSDDIPGLTFTASGRFVAIANQVVEREKISLDKAVLLYAQLGMALNDGGVAVWKSKYHYNVERPVTYIQRNFDKNWSTNLHNYLNGQRGITPPHPAYPSGHSGFGAAAAIILAENFGNNYVMTDDCHLGRTEFISTSRTFSKFTDMAVENAISRIPLGVHYRMDSDEGLRLGYLAGQRVIELPWKKK
jgi:hypothetical protein